MIGGFTLIEILLVLGLVSVVLALAPIFDLNYFKKDLRQEEMRTLVQDLQKARSSAMNNINGQNHGVTVYDKKYNEQIIFEKLTGNVAQEYEIVFEDGASGINNATITINYEGGIDW